MLLRNGNWKTKAIIISKRVPRKLTLFTLKLCNAGKTKGVDIVTVTSEIDEDLFD